MLIALQHANCPTTCKFLYDMLTALQHANCPTSLFLLVKLSGHIGKVVASHAAVVRSIPVEVALIYTMHEALRGYCPLRWGVRPVNWIYHL